MKDINGYLRKIVWIFSILFLITPFFHSKIFADTTLTTDSIFSHTVKSNSVIETTITFTISSDQRTVLTYYTITIPQEDIEPEIYSTNKKQSLEATVYHRTGSTDILIDFENTVIQRNDSTKISISYTHKYNDKNILNLVSQVADTTTSKVSITYPRDWGETSWISDQIENIKQNDDNYILTISKPDSDTIKLILGQDIVYQFEISRSLNNPTDSGTQYEILLPLDTQFQRIVIDDINVQPTQSIIDNSGNYILVFALDPQSQQDLKISGYIIMQTHEYYSTDFLNSTYNSGDIYWSLENKQIEDVEEFLAENGVTAQSETSLIAKYLYRYVIDNLDPSTSATTLSGGVRKGATEILRSTSQSTAEDYADVLKALLSYYEIPAIYTIGYVSDISSYQDNGMFHYWIQVYIDENWVVLDPYLEDFSNVSLWDREQLDHISILNRIYNSISPILTYYSDNDIKFEYISDSEIIYNPSSNISISLEPYSILNKYLYGAITVENTGNVIFTDIELIESQPDLNEYIDSITNSTNTILLPHDNKSINFHIPFNSLEDELIFTTVNIKNGDKIVDSSLASTEYSVSERTGYEILIKFISILLFVFTFSIIYIVINKVIYKK